MEQILLKQDLIKMIDSKELSVYITLRSIYTSPRKEPVCINSMVIYSELSGNLNITQTTRQRIEKAIESLGSKGLINIISKGSNGSYLIDISRLFFDSSKEHFVYVERNDLNLIMNSNSKLDKFNLLKHFVTILCLSGFDRVIKYNDKVIKRAYCNCALNVLSQQSKIQLNTISKYNMELQRLKVIYIFKDYMTNNVYCRYKYKEIIAKTYRLKI